MNNELFKKLLDEKRIPANTFLLGRVGSHAHGTFIPSTDSKSISDVDLMGVCVAPIESYLGLGNFKDVISKDAEFDIIVFEIRQFTRLLLMQNTAVLELLWLKDDLYIHNDIQSQYIEKRDIFSSKLAHKNFINHMYLSIKNIKINKFEKYMKPSRRMLVKNFGYDTKRVAHSIRIMRMGIEFLNTSKLNVFREDATELIAITNGKWQLDKVMSEADKLLKDAELAFKSTKLPDCPNTKEAELLLMNVIKQKLLN